MAQEWLENLLGEAPALQAAREKELARMRAADGLYVFGAGATSQQVLGQLRALGCSPAAFVDNNPEKAGTVIGGVPVITFAQCCDEIRESFFIYISVQRFYRQIFQQCIEFGIDKNCISRYDHIIQLPWEVDAIGWMCHNVTELCSLYEHLADDVSRDVLCRRCAFLLSRRRDFLSEVHRQCQYFEKDILKIGQDEVFVDLGTFTGDTIEAYIRFSGGIYKYIYGFEPDIDLFKKTVETVSGYNNITLEPLGTANYDGTARVSSSLGLMNSINLKTFQSTVTPEDTFRVCRLDSYFSEKSNMPTLIKMDIEGAELETLKGAENIIRDCKPKLAVCVYHLADDIINIPQLLYMFNKKYKLYLRHYSDNSTETVLYAV